MDSKTLVGVSCLVLGNDWVLITGNREWQIMKRHALGTIYHVIGDYIA